MIMVEKISVKSITNKSADLTITKEYLIVKGKHFQVKNGLLYHSDQTQSISVKNILSMEYLTIRSKRLLFLFMFIMILVIFGGTGIRKIYSTARRIDTIAQKVESAYNYVADEDIKINYTSSVMNAIQVVYYILVVGSVGCFLLYWFRPFRVLYISSLGKTIAVERRFYEKSQLDRVIMAWRTQLQ